MINFYKPTPKNTGSACSFTFRTKEGSLFCSFIKQASWNDATKRGSFEANKGKPESTVNVKYSPTEAGAFLDALDKGRKFSTVHKTETQTLTINFGPYMKLIGDKEQQVGYSYSIHKDAEGQKVNFLIGLNFHEGRLLREFIIASLQEHFKQITAGRDKNYAEYVAKKGNAPVEETQAEESVADESNLDSPA